MAATTFVDSYTLIDSVNAGPLYESNEGSATLTTDSYSPSSAPVIEAALRDLNPGGILDKGSSQKAIYELMLMIFVNWDNAMAALDDDGGVNKTDYESIAAIGSIGADYTSGTIAALMTLGIPNVKKVNLFPEGSGTPELAIACQAIASMLALATANLDLDSTLSNTNYAATLDIDFDANTAWVPPIAATGVPFNIAGEFTDGQDNPASKIKRNGIYRGALVDFLNTVVTNMNALWVKLDADI
jgi:hypothetical protein